MPNLDRLRAAAERLHARGPFIDPEERRRAERRTAQEVAALVDAIENGDPLPIRCHPPLSAAEQELLDAAHEYLDARRRQIADAARALRDAGIETDLTMAAERAGLLPAAPGTGPWSDDQDGHGMSGPPNT
jgi:hypothetical protein